MMNGYEIILVVGGVRYNLDVEATTSAPHTYDNGSIKDISVVGGAYSKSIQVSLTNHNLKVLEDITNFNTRTTRFDQFDRNRAIELMDGVIIMDGFFTVTDFSIDGWQYKDTVTINIFEESSDLWGNIGEDFVETLNFGTTYDHLYTLDTITQSHSNNYTNGYKYAIGDLGYNFHIIGLTLSQNQMVPCTYIRPIFDQILKEAGYTWYSNSVTQSTPLNYLLRPFNLKDIPLDDNYISDRAFRVGMNSYQNIVTTATYSKSNIYIFPPSPPAQPTNGNIDWGPPYAFPIYELFTQSVQFNNESSPNGDPNSVWSTTLYEYQNTTPYPITQRFGMSMEITQKRLWADITQPTIIALKGLSGSVTTPFKVCSQEATTQLKVSIDGSPWSVTGLSGGSTGNLNYGSLTASETYKGNWYTDYIITNPGEKVIFKYIYPLFVNNTVVPAGTTLATIGTASFIFNDILPKVTPGNIIPFQSLLPRKIKRRDWLLSIIKMFNLFIEADKNNPKNLRIETRDYYYQSGQIINDWVIDYHQPANGHLLSNDQKKRLTFTYKADKDFFNDDYTKKTKEIYGQYQYLSDNKNILDEQKFEIIFSPTPLVAIPLSTAIGSTVSSSFIIPKIGQQNGSNFESTDFNERILYDGGNLPNGNVTWTLYGIDSSLSPGSFSYAGWYPYVGHVDNPSDPTLDINFGQTKGLYYPQSIATNYNLFNAYYKQQVDEINDPDAKLLTCYIVLTPKQISNFRFNQNIFLDFNGDGGQYYRVNKIIDYDPLSNSSTQVELFKTKYTKVPRAFKKTKISPSGFSSGDPGVISNMDIALTNYYPSGTGVAIPYPDTGYLGDGNIVSGNKSFAKGNNIIISGDNSISESSDSKIFGPNNTIEYGATGSTILGPDNYIAPYAYNSHAVGSGNRIGLPNSIIIGNNVDTIGPGYTQGVYLNGISIASFSTFTSSTLQQVLLNGNDGGTSSILMGTNTTLSSNSVSNTLTMYDNGPIDGISIIAATSNVYIRSGGNVIYLDSTENIFFSGKTFSKVIDREVTQGPSTVGISTGKVSMVMPYNTTNAVTQNVYTIPMTYSQCLVIDIVFQAQEIAASSSYGSNQFYTFKMDTVGNVTFPPFTTGFPIINEQSDFSTAFAEVAAVSGVGVVLQVTGDVGKSINWFSRFNYSIIG